MIVIIPIYFLFSLSFSNTPGKQPRHYLNGLVTFMKKRPWLSLYNWQISLEGGTCVFMFVSRDHLPNTERDKKGNCRVSSFLVFRSSRQDTKIVLISLAFALWTGRNYFHLLLGNSYSHSYLGTYFYAVELKLITSCRELQFSGRFSVSPQTFQGFHVFS